MLHGDDDEKFPEPDDDPWNKEYPMLIEKDRLNKILENKFREVFFDKICEIKGDLLNKIINTGKNFFNISNPVIDLMKTDKFNEYYKLLNKTDPEKELIDDISGNNSIERYRNIQTTYEEGLVYNIKKDDTTDKYEIEKIDYVVNQTKNDRGKPSSYAGKKYDAKTVLDKLKGSFSTTTKIRKEDENEFQAELKKLKAAAGNSSQNYSGGKTVSIFPKLRRRTKKPRRRTKKPQSKSRRKNN